MKPLQTIRHAPEPHWVGDGFPVRTLFSYQSPGADPSPFLLLDYAAPSEFPPAEGPRGVGEHPHRGFETVTLVYDGEVEHRDSAGNSGRIGPGDVQWMTAASGVVHEEMHGGTFAERGGRMEMAQLWVNLPAAFKKSPPAYQTLVKSQIPVVELADGAGTLRVVAGEFQGAKGPARTFTPVEVWDLRLEPGGRVTLPFPAGHTAIVAALQGALTLNGDQHLNEWETAFFAREGDRITVEAPEGAKALVLGGEPITEPVVGYGPFVMNNEAEIRQAFEDYRTGKMGHLGA